MLGLWSMIDFLSRRKTLKSKKRVTIATERKIRMLKYCSAVQLSNQKKTDLTNWTDLGENQKQIHFYVAKIHSSDISASKDNPVVEVMALNKENQPVCCPTYFRDNLVHSDLSSGLDLNPEKPEYSLNAENAKKLEAAIAE